MAADKGQEDQRPMGSKKKKKVHNLKSMARGGFNGTRAEASNYSIWHLCLETKSAPKSRLRSRVVTRGHNRILGRGKTARVCRSASEETESSSVVDR